MPDVQKYCLLTGCSDNDVMEGSSNKSTKRIDPLLEMYVLCGKTDHEKNRSICVEESKANGSMCTFKCVKLKNGYQDCEILDMDGYFVSCVSCDKIDYMVVTLLLEGDSNRDVKLTLQYTTSEIDGTGKFSFVVSI